MGDGSLSNAINRIFQSLPHVAKECLMVLIAPYWLLMGCAQYVGHMRGKGLYISQSIRKNSINDHTGINTIANWMKRYGYWGINFENMGKPLGLTYPPLTYFLCRIFGPSGFFILCNMLFLSLGAYLALTVEHSLLILLPYVLVSPFYKNHFIICGRFDSIAIILYTLMLVFFHNGASTGVLILFLLMSLLHPSMLILGSITCGIEYIAGNISITEFLVVPLLTVLLISPWLFPYVSNARVTGNIGHSWKPLNFKDNTRQLSVQIQKTVFFGLFAFTYMGMHWNLETSLLLLLPLLLEINDYATGMFFNRFSIDLLKVNVGLYCLAHQWSVILVILYLLSIYYYASPSQRQGFEISTMRLETGAFQRLKAFLEPMGGRKCLVLSTIANADAWRTEAKHMSLLFLVNSYRAVPTFLNWFPVRADETITAERLLTEADRVGAEFMIATGNVSIPEKSSEFLGRMVIHKIGDVPPIVLTAYRIKNAKGLLEPHATFTLDKNRISVDVQKGIQYTLHLMNTKGWRAECDGIHVDLLDDSPDICFTAPKSASLILRHAYRNYWGSR